MKRPQMTTQIFSGTIADLSEKAIHFGTIEATIPSDAKEWKISGDTEYFVYNPNTAEQATSLIHSKDWDTCIKVSRISGDERCKIYKIR